MKSKIFILGIGSLTGHKIAIKLKNHFTILGSYNLRNPDFDFVKSFKLDIKDTNDVKKILYDCKPDYIINSCALNNVDYCESHPDEAKKINCEFVENIVKISESLGSKLIHLSTDSVFDGKKKYPYTETDTPNPINVYGNSKLCGEKIVLKNTNNLVVRASVLYGGLLANLSDKPSSSLKPMNFVLWLISKLKANENIQIIRDEVSSPIIADDFANSIIHLLKGDYSGLFHAAPNLCINRYEFSKKIAEELKLDVNLIEPVSNEKLGRKVNTGNNKCLDSTKLQTMTKFKFLNLKESCCLLKDQLTK